MTDELVLEAKFNDKLQSVFLNDYRIGGCKWNDIDNGRVIRLHIRKKDLLHELRLDKQTVQTQLRELLSALYKQTENKDKSFTIYQSDIVELAKDYGIREEDLK